MLLVTAELSYLYKYTETVLNKGSETLVDTLGPTQGQTRIYHKLGIKSIWDRIHDNVYMSSLFSCKREMRLLELVSNVF